MGKGLGVGSQKTSSAGKTDNDTGMDLISDEAASAGGGRGARGCKGGKEKRKILKHSQACLPCSRSKVRCVIRVCVCVVK